tara:strand:+ start:325 stop:543 length:219 start_codon:yes stop_codon:yes gene_type:complete
MNYYNDAYPEVITRLQNENKYLKNEIIKEKQQLEKTIHVLRKEIEDIKEDNRILSLEISNYLKRQEISRYTI